MDGRAWRLLALALLLAAGGLAAFGVATGALRFALLLVIPVLYGSGPLALLVIVLLVGAFAAWTAGAFADARAFAEREPQPQSARERYAADDPRARPSWAPSEAEEWTVRSGAGGGPAPPEEARARRGKWGGVVLIGPIPVAFGNDRRMLAVLMGLALLLVVAALLLFGLPRGA